MLEDLEGGLLEYENIREFLTDIRKEFGRKDEKSAKVTELRRLEQGSRTMEEFIYKSLEEQLKKVDMKEDYQ